MPVVIGYCKNRECGKSAVCVEYQIVGGGTITLCEECLRKGLESIHKKRFPQVDKDKRDPHRRFPQTQVD